MMPGAGAVEAPGDVEAPAPPAAPAAPAPNGLHAADGHEDGLVVKGGKLGEAAPGGGGDVAGASPHEHAVLPAAEEAPAHPISYFSLYRCVR